MGDPILMNKSLLWRLPQALYPHMDKTKQSTKYDDASMQRFELSPNDVTELLIREPLLIVRLSILNPVSHTHNVRPAKGKTYQYYTFVLSIPLELDVDDLALLKMERLS